MPPYLFEERLIVTGTSDKLSYIRMEVKGKTRKIRLTDDREKATKLGPTDITLAVGYLRRKKMEYLITKDSHLKNMGRKRRNVLHNTNKC